MRFNAGPAKAPRRADRLLNAVNKHGGPLSMELANELRMSKVMQLCAAIADRGFVLPKHLNLMSSDAGNRARSAGLIIVFTERRRSHPTLAYAPLRCS